MSRRRSERRKLDRAAGPASGRRRPEPLPVSVGAVVAAALLALICLVPFVLWGSNPYPRDAVRYWAWGTPAVLATAAIIALGPPWLGMMVSRVRRALDRPPATAFAAIAAALTLAMSVAVTAYMFRFSPTTSDDVAQLWHARILLEGRWFLLPDQNPEFFALENVIDRGRWYSQFPVGGPIAMMLGAALHAPWIVNPLFCALAAVGVYHFARRAFGETQGRAVAVVFGLTPMIVFLAGTWMNHVPVLALAMGAFAALAEWDAAAARRRRLVFAALIGACLGAAATMRPVDALILSVVIGGFQLWAIRREPQRLVELAVQGLVGALAVAPLLYANAMTTGNPLRFGYDVMWGAGHNIGFHEDPYGEVHTLGRAVTYAVTYVSKLNLSLFAWPVPALAVAIFALVSLRRVTRWDALLLALFALQVGVYASYSLVGELLGPRFLYTAIPTIIILVARLPFLVADRYGGRWGRAAAGFTGACLVMAWCLPADSSLNALALARHTRMVRNNMRVDAAEAVDDAGVHNAVVFVREPFSSRLLRRMWGVGVARGTAARLLGSRDACSLLTAVRATEADTGASPDARIAMVATRSTAFVDSPRRVRGIDDNALISSPESVTPECSTELRDDVRFPTLLFGPTLPLEPIDDDGRVNGDVIYVADLGDRNVILRSRFGDRPWYRLVSTPVGNGSYRAELVPY